MHLIESFWSSVTYVVSFLTLSPIRGPNIGGQAPLLVPSNEICQESRPGPIFKPPGGRLTGPGSDFLCDYSKMVGWTNCSTAEDRTCWLRNASGAEYNIKTNYEDINQTPIGITRHYHLDLTKQSVNADGEARPEAKIFNGTYPGPWIQACWGDNITVTVTNHVPNNGTSVHWHGIRQYLSNPEDGVNGVTQCPIAPGDTLTYSWRALQYGSSWYHSHYSVQYADGALGPMTLHGPTSEPYDEAKRPILLSDWGHNSAFESLQTGVVKHPSTLLNGVGNVTRFNNTVKNTLPLPEPYTLNFDPPVKGRAKRYLLRLINTSFESTFVFSIDNHLLQIVGADFVPLHSYVNTSVLIGIGQRYHVIVTADPQSNGKPLPTDGNFWIRSWRADCFLFDKGMPGYEKAGILRYGDSKALPTSTNWTGIALDCSDETYTSLKPIVPWTVGKPANDPTGQLGEKLTVQFKLNQESIFPLAKFSMGGDDFNPLQIDYGDPTFLHLNYTGKFNPLWVVFPETYQDTDWVYLVLRGLGGQTFGAHPIHLHGHDFAILQQLENATFPAQLNLTLNNPPRRDVVLLPTNGYVVIAFKTDNPGSWLMHCHIATHASFGLALQILERQQSAAALWPSLKGSPALKTAQRNCNGWNKWWGDCRNWWPGDGSSCDFGENEFSPDSGI